MAVVGVSAETLFHGIFTLLFAISTAIFLRRGLNTRASWAMFTITIVTYAISTMYCASNFAITAYGLKTSLIDQSNLDLAAKIKLLSVRKTVAKSVYMCTAMLPPIISDAVVIWRAWVLFPERRWVMILPVSMLVGTTSCTLAFIALSLAHKGSGKPLNDMLYGSTFILSLSTNIIATLMITYKLWSHRKFLVKDLGLNRGQSAVQKVLDIMVESGFSYCALQIITVTLDYLPTAPELGSPFEYAVQVFLSSYTILSAMYPTIVIVLVNSQRSFVDTYGFSSAWNEGKGMVHSHGSRPPTVGHLSFAASPPTEGTVHLEDNSDAVEKGEAASVKGRNEGYDRHAATTHF